MDITINGFGGLGKKFEGFEFLKSINLDDYKNNQQTLFNKVFDYTDKYDTKNERNTIIKSLISDICMSPYQKKEKEAFKIDEIVLETMCDAYFNENNNLGFNSNSVSLATFLNSYSNQSILHFFKSSQQYTATKAAFLIEIYSTCEHQSTLKKNFSGSLFHVAKKQLEAWTNEGINFYTYELAEELLSRIVYGSRFKVSNTNQERFFSYIDDKFYPKLTENHPEFIFNTNKTYLVMHLIEKGYDKVILNNKEKTKEKINYYLRECMFSQAKHYLPFVILEKDDLIQTDEYLKEKLKGYGFQFQRKMYEEFKVYLENQYLNNQMLEIEPKQKNKKAKI